MWRIYLPSGYDQHSHGSSMALIEIDGLPINSMVNFHGELLVITRWYIICQYNLIYIYMII